MNKRHFWLFVALPFFWPALASANVGEAFGLGAQIRSLGGASGASGGTSISTDPFATYHNPAALGLGMPSGRRLSVSFGLLGMNPQLLPIRQVIGANSFTSDAAAPGTRSDFPNTSYRATLGQELGLAYRFFSQNSRSLTLGLATYLPLSQLMYLDTGHPYQPEYPLYRARTQRPQIHVALGGEFAPGWRLGAGIHMAFALTAKATVFLAGDPARGASWMQFESSAKPKLSPYVGALYTAPPAQEGAPAPYALGAVIRFPNRSLVEMDMNSRASFFAGGVAPDFNLRASSALYDDPWTVELGGAWQETDTLRGYAQVDYQLWKAYLPPALQVDTQNPALGLGVILANGWLPSVAFQNIWLPRVGQELALSDSSTLRLGYAYRPSILAQLPQKAGNLLDPPKHQLNVGYGLKFNTTLGWDIPSQLDLNLSYQALITQQITKSPGNEIGDLTDSKVGFPGYQAGGKVWGGGMTLSMAL